MAAQTIKRTTSNDKDFQWLIKQLDSELWNELQEDQAQYDQYNKVPDLNTVVVVYVDDQPAASGCFKKYNADTVEIKRMFVVKEHRGKNLSKMVLNELEHWAAESGFTYAILETSIHFIPATTLYKNAGYKIIPNYDQYKGLEESVCMKKSLPPRIQKT
jgi:GNAT superfamily N-acetyltransferase